MYGRVFLAETNFKVLVHVGKLDRSLVSTTTSRIIIWYEPHNIKKTIKKSKELLAVY